MRLAESLVMALGRCNIKIRNPKIEIRNKFEIQITKYKTCAVMSIWIWDFEFVSDFDFRISGFSSFG